MAQLLEEMLPGVKSDGLNTNKPAVFGSTVTFTGGTVGVITAYTTTATLTAGQTGSVILWNAAAGFTINLPAPVVGLTFEFAVQTSVTSSNHKVITNSASVFLLGGVLMSEASGSTNLIGLADGSASRAVTMNGTTTGGLIGTAFSITCITATQWLLEGIVAGSGSLATPIATS